MHYLTHHPLHFTAHFSIITSVDGQQGLETSIVGLLFQSTCHGLTEPDRLHQILDSLTTLVIEAIRTKQTNAIVVQAGVFARNEFEIVRNLLTRQYTTPLTAEEIDPIIPLHQFQDLITTPSRTARQNKIGTHWRDRNIWEQIVK